MLFRLTCLLILAQLVVTGCASVLNFANSTYDFCPSNTDTSHQYFGPTAADELVVFIHGLCGDAKSTWTNTTTHFIFPKELARDLAEENRPAYVFVFDYISRLKEGPSVQSIADHLEFEIGELLKKHPYRTLRIVAHSMGGLVAREYILRRQLRSHPQLKATNVVLLATPNNGSELAELGRLISESRQVEELRHIDKGNSYLESLNKDWNREFKGGGHPRHVLLYAGYEELGMSVFGRIVKYSSAISYADESMGFQQDHVSISKPKDADDVIYRWVKSKLSESLQQAMQHLVAGIVKQGLLPSIDVPERLPRNIEPLEGLQALPGAELEKVLTYVNAGQLQKALALLAESETKEHQLIENVARRRFAQGQIYELLFLMAQAASYYSQAVQLAPSNALYRNRYGRVLLHRGEVGDAVLQFEDAIRLSRSSNILSSIEADALAGLGTAYKGLAQYSKAIEFQEQALLTYRKVGGVRGEGNALRGLGAIYASLGQYSRAIEFQGQALAIYRKIGDAGGEGHALRSLGAIYANLGQYSRAIELQEQGLAIFRKVGDVHSEGAALGSLGATYINVGQYSKAVEFQEQAIEIYHRVGDIQGEGNVLGNLGATYITLGQSAKAIDYLEQALTIFRKVGDMDGEGNALGNLGATYASLKQSARAIESLEQALAILRKVGDIQAEGNTLGSLGAAYASFGQSAKAIESLEQALVILRKVGDMHGEGNVLGNLGATYITLGQSAKAIDYLEQALAILRKVGDMHGEGNALGNLGATYINLGQPIKAIEFLKASEVIFQNRLQITFPWKSDLQKLNGDNRN